jgi:hypothetical protein
MQPQLVTTPPKSNTPTYDSLLQVAKDLGVQSGMGKDTQIKFDLTLIEGAYLGTLSLDPDRHGTGRDDGTTLAEAYTRARQGATAFDAKSDAGRKQVSNTRKCIKLGSNPKWGRGQPMQTVQEFVRYWQDCRKDPAKAKKLDDVHNALMRFATAQLKSDQLIPDDERNRFAFKTEKDEKTEMEKLDDIRKAIKKTGDQSVQIKAAYDQITLRITNIVKGVK